MSTRLILGLSTILALGLVLSACGTSRLSDSEIAQTCDLVVRCNPSADRTMCLDQLVMTRDQAATLGCSSEFALLARCFLRADSCTTTTECDESQSRLDACASRGAPDAGSGPPSRPGETRSCTPGSMVSVGCAAGCGLGSCSGDPILRICDGTTSVSACAALSTDSDPQVISANDDASECSSGLCSFTTFTCPPSGSFTVTHRPFGTGSYSCAWDVR